MKPAVRILANALFIQVGFVVLWFFVAAPYTRMFCSATQWIVGDIFGEESIVLRPAPGSALASGNVEIEFRKLESRSRFSIPYGSGYGGYFPATFLLSLVLASPVSWARRVRIVLMVETILLIAMVSRVWVLGVRAFSPPGPLQRFELGEQLRWSVDFLVATIIISPVSGMIFATILWFAFVALRPPVVERILPHRYDPTAPP